MVSESQSSAIVDYLSYAAIEKGLSKNTIDAYRRDLTKFKNFLANNDLLIQDVNSKVIDDFLGWLRGADGSNSRGSESSNSRTIVTVRNLYKFISTSIYIPDLDFRNSVEFKGYWVFGNKINCIHTTILI